MATPKICINGMGRLGREIIRQLVAASTVGEELFLINDPQMSASQLVYLLKYDSIYLGRNNPFYDGGHTLEADPNDNYIMIDGKQYTFEHKTDVSQLSLGQSSIDTVIECSGAFTTQGQLQAFFNAGASHVICPYLIADTTIPIYVDGVNTIGSAGIYSLGSPEIIALSNILKPINDNYGVVSVNTNALLCYNNTMNLMDYPTTTNTNLLNYNKAAAQNMIPSNSKVPFKAVSRVIQELNDNKMTGNLCYTGVPFGNLLYITIKTQNSATIEDMNGLIKSSSGSASWDKFSIGSVCVDGDLITPIDVCGNKAQVLYLAPYSAAATEENTFTLVCTYDATASLAAYALYMAETYYM